MSSQKDKTKIATANSGIRHFTVTGEFMTSHSRSLWWDEDQKELVLKTLGCLVGASEGQILDVIFGNSKLTGDSNKGIGIKPDSTRVSPHGNKIFPSLTELLRHEKEKRSRLLEKEQREVASALARESARYDKEDDPVDAWITEMIDDSDKPLEPDDEFKASCGWINREGSFYPCAYMGHTQLANELESDEISLENRGWVKISDPNASPVPVPNRESVFYEGPDILRPTESQKHAVREWCLIHDKRIPSWASDL